MNWYLYAYLLVAALLALVLLVIVIRLIPELSVKSKKPHKYELVVLLLLLALGLFTVYGNFFLGNSYFAYLDVGSDTLEQYIPYYINLLGSIRKGTLGLWNYEFGLGVSFMSYQSWTLDPFNLVLIPLGLALGNSALGQILIFIQALKVLACGLLFDALLCRYCSQPISRILGSALFAFCGFLMLWGQHYWLGSTVVMAIGITVALEALLERRTAPRFVAVCLLTAGSIMMSAYSGFMIMLYATAYALLRCAYVLKDLTPRTYFVRFGRLTAPVICGILISCLTLVPYAMLILNESSRITGTVGSGSLMERALGYLSDFVPLRWIPMILSRLLGNSLISTGADIPADLVPPTSNFGDVNIYEFMQLGFSAGAIILLGQFFHWLITESSRREKVLASIAAALCALYCLNSFLPAFSNIFVGPKYRSAFALATPICIAIAVGWEKRVMTGRVSKPMLIATLALTLGVEAWSLLNAVTGRIVAVCFIAASLIIATAISIPSSARRRTAVLACACAVTIGSSVADGYFTTNRRSWATDESFPLASEPNNADDTTEALAWLEESDTSFYRVEKLYNDWTRLEDSLIQGYMGAASYCSTLDSDVAEFYQKLWPGMVGDDWAYQVYVNDPDQPELLNMLGIKYVLAHDELDFPWATLVNQFGDVYIYQVKGSQSILSLRAGYCAESDADKQIASGVSPILAITTIVPDDEVATIEQHKGSTAASDSSVADPTTDASDAALPEDMTLDEAIDSSWLSSDADPYEITLANGVLTGSITSTANGTVACLAIPHTTGWNIYIDGERVEAFRANYGFIGFVVDAGEHTFEARFEPEGITLGCALALAGLAGAVASCFFITTTTKSNRGKHAAIGRA